MESIFSRAAVFIIDDDEALRDALNTLFRSVGLRAEAFASASEFLKCDKPDVPSCLVLDVRLPGLSGLDFQSELRGANILIPIIFMTGHGDVLMSVKAMKAGAADFLAKPLHEQGLLDAVRAALERDKTRLEQEITNSDVQIRFDLLTAREKEVMALVTRGLMNKQIAGEMGISEATVKFHRGRIMRKMTARSLADLVKMTSAIHQ